MPDFLKQIIKETGNEYASLVSEGGEQREKDYADCFKEKENNREYKVEVTDNEWFFKRYYKRNW